MSQHFHVQVPSPLGPIRCVADQDALVSVSLPAQEPGEDPSTTEDGANHQVLRQAARELAAYFGGALTVFTVPLRMGGTEFQRAVWSALLQIPFGETRSYSDLAVHIGRPKAVRAVGAANGKNPLGIIVPCHRVIGADGTLTGYAGGLDSKRWLLRHEGASFGRGAGPASAGDLDGRQASLPFP